MWLSAACRAFNFGALSLASLLVVDDSGDFAVSFIDLFNDDAPCPMKIRMICDDSTSS